MLNNDHIFVVCAYKESIYLQKCIESLKSQTIKSNIICTTSTPNNHIENICKLNNIPLYINPERNGLAADWNFAYSKAEAKHVTLAHQDDIYEPNYLEEILKNNKESKKPIIFFSNYYEIRNEKKIIRNKLLIIKRIMCFPWLLKIFNGSRFIARRIFMFGSPICCPSVTYFKENILRENIFDNNFRNSCDWLAWIKLRELRGDFLYCPKMLMGHRIHEESETTNLIDNNTRSEEDLKIFKMLMPETLANIIHRFYCKAQKSNKIS